LFSKRAGLAEEMVKVAAMDAIWIRNSDTGNLTDDIYQGKNVGRLTKW
jgi:hypothetical protein